MLLYKTNTKELEKIEEYKKHIIFLKLPDEDMVECRGDMGLLFYNQEIGQITHTCKVHYAGGMAYREDCNKSKIIDVRNLDLEENRIEAAIVDAISKGFDEYTAKHVLKKDNKFEDKEYFRYAVDIGFSDDVNAAYIPSNKWNYFITFDKMETLKKTFLIDDFYVSGTRYVSCSSPSCRRCAACFALSKCMREGLAKSRIDKLETQKLKKLTVVKLKL